jgi:hypothetical protein
MDSVATTVVVMVILAVRSYGFDLEPNADCRVQEEISEVSDCSSV